MLDIGTSEDFDFHSNSILFKNIKGSKSFEKYQILPSWSPFWDIKILSIFLNQLTNFEPVSERSTRLYKSARDYFRTFKFINTGTNPIVYIHISFNNNFDISVLVSREMLLDETIFTEKPIDRYSFTYNLRYDNLSESA